MTVVVFKRASTKPASLTKGEIVITPLGSSFCEMYVGNNSDLPVSVTTTNASNLNLTALTDINAAVVDSDELLINDVSVPGNRKTIVGRLWTYIALKLSGAISTFLTVNATASRVIVSNTSGKLATSTVSITTLGYLDATSSIQTQLNGKQATLTSGLNIKSVNGASLLGVGDLTVTSASGINAFSGWRTDSGVNAVTGVIGNYNNIWINDGNMNTTTGAYTVPISGVYKIEFHGIKHNNNTATEIRLYKNGMATGVRSWIDSTTSGEFENGTINVVGVFQANDVLDIRVNIGGLHGNESCYLTIYRLR